jgi:NO-binding membrane sensor protein with MHYT domain
VADIHHFEYGWITPVLSYVLAVLGSFLGLLCTARIRTAAGPRQRAWWLVLAAIAIGGTAVWTMHFIAMLGFGVGGTQIRYDVPMTVASAMIAVAAVGVGLFIVGYGRASVPRILAGGLFAGLGVAAMHYTGMAAMRLNGQVRYDGPLLLLSVLIAVVAATTALWLAVAVHRTPVIAASALVMGVAVSGMHYTGMAAMSVHLHPATGDVSGATVTTLLLPIMLAVIFVLVGLFYAVLAAPTEEDREAAEYLATWRTQREAVATPPPARNGFTPRGGLGGLHRNGEEARDPRR